MSLRGHWVALLILSGGFLWSCAKVGAPPGGAEDKTGPTVVSHFPEQNATRVPRRMVATLEFSEPVNHTAVEASLFLSPDPGTRLRYRWRNHRLDLIYLDSLEADRTYVISVGSQAKDLRGNAAGQSFTIAFSTGEHIDRGSIDGSIADVESPRSVALWAYQMHGDSVPDPTSTIADYRLQAGSDGKFRFMHIREGKYRVFAVLDRNRNGLWDPVGESIGVPPWDVAVTDSTMPWVCFRLTDQDTTAPVLRSTREVSEFQVDLRVSRPLSSVEAWLVQQQDSLHSITTLPDSADEKLWHVHFANAATAGSYLLLARGEDMWRRPWSGWDSIQVRARSDTVRPRVLRSFPPPGAMLRTIPDSLVMVFSEAVRSDSLYEAAFTLSIGDSDSTRLALTLIAANQLTMRPEVRLTAGRRYVLRYPGFHVQDYAGNTLPDSIAELRFGILPADSLGTLRGTLAGGEGSHLIRVLTVKGHREVAAAVLQPSSAFVLERIPPGKYLVEVTRDADHDGAYSPGGMFPFTFSDPFVVATDTVSIRARWEYETQIVWPANP